MTLFSKIMILLVVLAMTSCKETTNYSSGDYTTASSSKNLEISNAEAETILQSILDRYNNGENLDSSIKAMLRILTSQLSDKYPWQGITLSETDRQAILLKRDFYLSEITGALNSYKFVDGCDGLLFSSLGAVARVPVDLFQAESEKTPGRWYRSASQDCFKNGESESTISRDMLLGLALALQNGGELKAVERLIKYSIENRGIIGEASSELEQFGRAFMSPSLDAMFHEIQFNLGGEDSDRRGYIPDLSKDLTGFRAHLQVLGMILRIRLHGGLFKQDLDILQNLSSKQDKNALFQSILLGFKDGQSESRLKKIVSTLLDESLFPSDRLPSSSDRCPAPNQLGLMADGQQTQPRH